MILSDREHGADEADRPQTWIVLTVALLHELEVIIHSFQYE